MLSSNLSIIAEASWCLDRTVFCAYRPLGAITRSARSPRGYTRDALYETAPDPQAQHVASSALNVPPKPKGIFRAVLVTANVANTSQPRDSPPDARHAPELR